MIHLQKVLALLLVATLMNPTHVLAQQTNLRGHGMVVSIQHEASDAGLAILKQGGNAVDAAVAVGFALAVVFPRAGNIGGGGFMLLRLKSGAAHFLDFRERAPAAATPDMYLGGDGEVIPGLSTLGYKALGVPGTVKGLAYAQKHFGKLSLAQVMAPAIRLAQEGFVLTAPEAANFHNRNLGQFPESRRVFQRDGDFYKEGDTFKQPDLARTLERIAADPEDFYHGKIATQLAASVQSHGGLLTAADLADYQVADRKPLVGQYTAKQGRSDAGTIYDVITSPPPSSGGIVLLETLNILSRYHLAEAGGDRSDMQVHLITEALRRAYMDRADYLGDPDYTEMPLKQMLSQRYADAWQATIDSEGKVKPTPSAELHRPAGFLPPPPAAPAHKEASETTHYSVVDADGNAVSTTYTLNGFFGCGATAEGLGFVLNNEMDDFSSKPGKANMFGLVQSAANAVGPGHRPLSSMTPTLVTTHATAHHPAKLVLVLGSPGGSTIISTVANDLLSILVNGLSVQASADAPRFHHQYLPDILEFEKAFPHEVVEALRGMGYKVSQTSVADAKTPGVWGGSELIAIDPSTGALSGANDFRYPTGKVSFY